MANWVLAIDGDAGRRESFGSRIAQRVAPFDGLRVVTHVGTDWVLASAANPQAPVDSLTAPGSFTMCWGEPRDASGAVASAATIAAAWRGGESAQWDGFYAALSLDEAERSLTVGTDVLGIFPVYHWSDHRGTVLVGTSPELFRAHPNFSPALNPAGLVGILLTNGLVDGETLWQGVKRLAPGHRLRVVDGRLREEECYRFPADAESADLPLEGHVEILADVVASAVRRHVPAGRDYGLLLSGGLDSRMVAGFMMRAQVKPRTLTIGVPTDLDMRCAQAVAREYGFGHRGAEPSAAHYVDYANLQARWEHLANGFNTLRDWWIQSQVVGLGDRLAIGGLADSIIGGTSLSWAYSPAPPTYGSENFFRNMPRLGVPRAIIENLCVAPQHKELVSDIERKLTQEFDGYSDRKSRCAWRYDLAHGQRFHVGSSSWRLSFGNWPVLPVLDRAVIEAASVLPASSLANRVVQLELVRTQLPELASLPLDRSDLMSDEPQYLAPRTRHLVVAALKRTLRKAQRLPGLARFGKESRYWHRVNNFDGEAWRSVRRNAVDEYRALDDIFDVDLLQSVLPVPGQPAAQTGKSVPWIGESGRKLLLGLVYWAHEHR